MEDKNKKLFFLKGLPASGKSTESKKLLSQYEKIARINKDDIRKMFSWSTYDLNIIFSLSFLSNMMLGKEADDDIIHKIEIALVNYFSDVKTYVDFCKALDSESYKDREKYVIKIQTIIIKELVFHNYNIIIDDTNYSPKHFNRITSFCKNYEHIIIDMHEKYEVTVEECITRNRKRKETDEGYVPEAAIYRMAILNKVAEFSNYSEQEYEPFDSNEKCIICDLDGTLADCSHRLPFLLEQKKKDWISFYTRMSEDEVRRNVKDIVEDEYGDCKIVIVTGRPRLYEIPTKKWLHSKGIKYDALYMRSTKDYRPDTIVKKEILEKYLDKEKVEVAIDDRKRVISMWRQNGIPVIDVGVPDSVF